MEDILKYIFKKRDHSNKLSLDRVKILLNYLDNPQDKLKFIHVTGTNGKGSITTTISNVLIEAGYKVGKYISPYVDNFYERIQINNEYINNVNVQEIVGRLMPCIDSMEEPPTPFDILAALAFEYFYENKCDIVCLEVGMGGRFDPTNCITTTLVSIISIIDYDHTKYLGNTLEEIAFEKCGIIKEGKVTISYPLQSKNASKIIEAMAEVRNNKLIKFDLTDLTDIEKLGFNYSFKYKQKEYVLGLNGKHQIYNALIAIESVEELNNLGFKISYETIYKAIKNTKFIGRLDVVKENPIVMLDGAHNISGARALKQFILENSENRKVILIIGMIQGKPSEEFFKELEGLASNIIIVEVKDEIKKSADIKSLFEIAKKYNKNVEIEIAHKDAYEKAKSFAGKNDIIIIAGSLYLLSEFYDMFKNVD